MGCYPPLAKFVSKALGKCNGRDRWREAARLDMDYAMAYPPGPPMQTHYVQPVARTVTFASNNNVYVIPQQKTPPPSPPPSQQQEEQGQKQSTPEGPQQQQQAPPQQAEPDHQDTPPQPQPEQPEPPAPEQEEKAPDAAPPEEPKPKPPKGPKRGKNKKPGGRVRFGPEPPPPQEQQQPPQQEEQHDAPDHGNEPGGQEGQQQGRHGSKGPGPGQVPPYLFRYTPSPLPRWEATPRRHEYFSGEYRNYYPTPVREGIYRIATDANRLTTIFSEENPNACTIV